MKPGDNAKMWLGNVSVHVETIPHGQVKQPLAGIGAMGEANPGAAVR